MRKIFIPHGETITHDCLYTDRIILNGVLRISGKLSAKTIVGNGVIEAGEIVCDDLRADQVTADCITAKRIATNKLFVKYECRATDAVAVKDYATAKYLSTGTLSVTLSDIPACDADKVIIIKKKSSLVGLLWASWWRSLYLSLFHSGKKAAPKAGNKPIPIPAEVPSAVAQSVKEKAIEPLPKNSDAVDMLICLLAEMKKHGYAVTESEAQAPEETAA